MHRTEEQWIEEYQARRALWIHDGNPCRPHALLSSGKHSSGYFNSELVIKEPKLLDQAAADVLELLEKAGLCIKDVHSVFGPAMGAVTLAHDLARHIGYKAASGCSRGYTVKTDTGKMVLDDRVQISPGDRVLPAEDVITTFRSVKLMTDILVERKAELLPFVGALVNRSGLSEVAGFQIVGLIVRPMGVWDPPACLLCSQGSEAIRPKAAENWARLTAHY